MSSSLKDKEIFYELKINSDDDGDSSSDDESKINCEEIPIKKNSKKKKVNHGRSHQTERKSNAERPKSSSDLVKLSQKKSKTEGEPKHIMAKRVKILKKRYLNSKKHIVRDKGVKICKNQAIDSSSSERADTKMFNAHVRQSDKKPASICSFEYDCESDINKKKRLDTGVFGHKKQQINSSSYEHVGPRVYTANVRQLIKQPESIYTTESDNDIDKKETCAISCKYQTTNSSSSECDVTRTSTKSMRQIDKKLTSVDTPISDSESDSDKKRERILSTIFGSSNNVSRKKLSSDLKNSETKVSSSTKNIRQIDKKLTSVDTPLSDSESDSDKKRERILSTIFGSTNKVSRKKLPSNIKNIGNNVFSDTLFNKINENKHLKMLSSISVKTSENSKKIPSCLNSELTGKNKTYSETVLYKNEHLSNQSTSSAKDVWIESILKKRNRYKSPRCFKPSMWKTVRLSGKTNNYDINDLSDESKCKNNVPLNQQAICDVKNETIDYNGSVTADHQYSPIFKEVVESVHNCDDIKRVSECGLSNSTGSQMESNMNQIGNKKSVLKMNWFKHVDVEDTPRGKCHLNKRNTIFNMPDVKSLTLTDTSLHYNDKCNREISNNHSVNSSKTDYLQCEKKDFIMTDVLKTKKCVFSLSSSSDDEIDCRENSKTLEIVNSSKTDYLQCEKKDFIMTDVLKTKKCVFSLSSSSDDEIDCRENSKTLEIKSDLKLFKPCVLKKGIKSSQQNDLPYISTKNFAKNYPQDNNIKCAKNFEDDLEKDSTNHRGRSSRKRKAGKDDSDVKPPKIVCDLHPSDSESESRKIISPRRKRGKQQDCKTPSPEPSETSMNPRIKLTYCLTPAKEPKDVGKECVTGSRVKCNGDKCVSSPKKVTNSRVKQYIKENSETDSPSRKQITPKKLTETPTKEVNAGLKSCLGANETPKKNLGGSVNELDTSPKCLDERSKISCDRSPDKQIIRSVSKPVLIEESHKINFRTRTPQKKNTNSPLKLESKSQSVSSCGVSSPLKRSGTPSKSNTQQIIQDFERNARKTPQKRLTKEEKKENENYGGNNFTDKKEKEVSPDVGRTVPSVNREVYKQNVLSPLQRNITVTTPVSKKKLGRGFLTPSMAKKEHGRKEKNCDDLDTTRKQLHISTVPKSLPCRDAEFDQIKSFLIRKIEHSTGGCMYISGVPGTGKTATVHAVIRSLQQEIDHGDLPDFDFVEVNGLRLTEPKQAYVRILQALTDQKLSPDQAQQLLNRRFSGTCKKSTIILVDELDYLCNRRQDVVYNILDWPTKQGSALVVLTISNTMDLPERTLKGRVTSRMGLTRVTFQPYSHHQLKAIVEDRLSGTETFHPDAVQLVARKVAAVSGDARRALDICRRTTELVGHGEQVTVAHVERALTQIFSGPRVIVIQSLCRAGQLVLRALRDVNQRTGVDEATVTQVYQHLQEICLVDGCLQPTVGAVLQTCVQLVALGLIVAEKGRTDITRKMSLNVSSDDIHYALDNVKL